MMMSAHASRFLSTSRSMGSSFNVRNKKLMTIHRCRHHSRASVEVLPIMANVASSSSTSYTHNRRFQQGAAFQEHTNFTMAASAVLAASLSLLGGSTNLGHCEASSSSGGAAMNDEQNNDLPTYTMAQVSQNNGMGSDKRVWMTYGGNVYDVTNFIPNHPGGSEKILLAAGGPVEPHWHLYRQHFATDLPQQLMEKMLIGYLDPTDQEEVDEDMENLTDSEDGDPYAHEPVRSPLLIVHGDTPMNAEVPAEILEREYITPVSEFYIRHHHPVPMLSEKDIDTFQLEVDLSLLSNGHASKGGDNQKRVAKLSLAQIKSLPKVEVTTTLQCSGNRRSGFNTLRGTSGTNWGQGAISTAKWGGARLVDVLMLASQQLASDDGDNPNQPKCGNLIGTMQKLQDLIDQYPNLQHLRFESLDGMLASIDIIKALSPFGDVIIAYEMNDEPLTRDHGFPLRVIVPGYAAVRNVKWLSKLELAEEQAEGAWQRGLNYKVLPPSVLDAKEVDLDQMPGLGEVSVFSGITSVSRVTEGKKLVPGETVVVKARGWAWAGKFICCNGELLNRIKRQ
jgi:sulfite oxidase